MSYQANQDEPIIDAFAVYHWPPEKAHPDFDIDLARKLHNLESPQDYDTLRLNELTKLRTDHG